MPPEPQPQQGLSPEELENEMATDLPEREALSVVDPGVFSVLPTPVQVGRTAEGAAASDTGVQDVPPAA
jgi:hypothetical protein